MFWGMVLMFLLLHEMHIGKEILLGHEFGLLRLEWIQLSRREIYSSSLDDICQNGLHYRCHVHALLAMFSFVIYELCTRCVTYFPYFVKWLLFCLIIYLVLLAGVLWSYCCKNWSWSDSCYGLWVSNLFVLCSILLKIDDLFAQIF